jgi:hypothetical protein
MSMLTRPVDPLRASVDRLTDTTQGLVTMLAPMGAAEHEAQRVRRFFGRCTATTSSHYKKVNPSRDDFVARQRALAWPASPLSVQLIHLSTAARIPTVVTSQIPTAWVDDLRAIVRSRFAGF